MMAIARGATGQLPFGLGKLLLKLPASSRVLRRSPASGGRVICPVGLGYTMGRQAPSTKTASLSPGHGGIVAPSALRGSGPSLRN